mgnify:CR=1 FL=1
MIKQWLVSIARFINPSLGHIDACYIVGDSLFVFGWRNPDHAESISLRVAVASDGEKLAPVLRLDYDRADVSSMFSSPISVPLGSCWVFSIKNKTIEKNSNMTVKAYLRRLSFPAQKNTAAEGADVHSNLFLSLDENQRAACALASKGDFSGLTSRRKWSFKSDDTTDSGLSGGSNSLIQDVVSWGDKLYLKIKLNRKETLKNVIVDSNRRVFQGVIFKLPGDQGGSASLVVITGVSFVDGKLILSTSAGRVIRGRLTCEPSSHVAQVLKLMLGDLDFRKAHTVDWLNTTEFSRYLADLEPTVPPEDVIRIEKFNVDPISEETFQCSVIIPVYGRLDLIRYQIHAFSAFPNNLLVEYIFFLDDPRIEKEFFSLITQLAKSFPLPIKAIHASYNLGFGVANNTAVVYAQSDRILLLNSDVFPKSPGWFDQLMTTFESKADMGILGAKLLYADGTIQHAGMSSKISLEFPSIILNDHPNKGMTPAAVDLSPLVECQLVTGACMMLERELFLSLGGFDSQYLIGDFEDSDLCLRVYQQGKKNYLLNDIELCHVERQSQNIDTVDQWKQNLTLYNGWLYTRRWQAELELLL